MLGRRVERAPLLGKWSSFLLSNFWNKCFLVVQVLSSRDHPLDVGWVRVALDIN